MADRESSSKKGVSLAKGPVGILGLAGIVFGIAALLFGGHGFAMHVPHGAVHGKTFLGVMTNGWTALLFVAAGLALVLAAPLHWGAKSMSLLVGWVMLAAAVIAIIRGNGVFGIFAANHLTELVWAAAGVLLLVLALLPRVGGHERERGDEDREARPGRRVVTRERVATDGGGGARKDRAPAVGARRTDNPESR